MRTPLAIPALCICVLIGGLVGYAWAQATMDAEAESKLVKSVIDQMIKAVNSGDLNLLLAQYADDAKIDSRAAGAKVSKRGYAEAMSRNFQQGSILSTRYTGLKITFVDATHAVAEGTLQVTLKGGGGFVSRHEWKLEKRDGRWLIVETNYK
jgi:hypothetical protein